VNQKFGDIGAMRLVFRLVGNQLYRANKPLLRIRCGENNALPGGHAVAIRSQNAVAVCEKAA
jgi:hypothetical protein